MKQPTGAARAYYLVEWEGYDPSWEAWRIQGEPGTPLCTWELVVNILPNHHLQIVCPPLAGG